MKFITPLLVSFSLLAFAAQAADDAKKSPPAKPSVSQSTSGSASAGASGTKARAGARADFDKLDKNKDGQLSRAEFEAMHKASAGASTGKAPSSKTAK